MMMGPVQSLTVIGGHNPVRNAAALILGAKRASVCKLRHEESHTVLVAVADSSKAQSTRIVIAFLHQSIKRL